METKLRQVKIEEYWPLIVKNTDEFQQIAVAENPEFNKLAECIYRVLKDGFIHDATEYGVERWESILKLTPAETDTLDDRKARILTQLSVKIPYTWRVLEKMVGSYLTDDQWVMEYVNDEGKLVIHTDRVEETKLETIKELLERVLPQNIELVQYNHNMEISWRDKLYKYAECVTVEDMITVNPDYQNDLTSEGEWLYELPKLKRLFKANDWMDGFFAYNKKIKKWNVDLPSVTQFGMAFAKSTIEEFYGKTPAFTTPTICCYSGKLYEQSGFTFLMTPLRIFVGDLSKAKVLDYGTFEGLKYLEVFDTELTSADYLMCFQGCQFNKNIAITILSKFQSKEALAAFGLSTRCLGNIGIHVDHKNDEDVLAAIAEVEAKGWKMTVQWNGTPTSTASTMSFGQLIYATVDVKENPDGTVKGSLIWGHYVTDPTGYKTFRSLESAYKYFNLEMPATGGNHS